MMIENEINRLYDRVLELIGPKEKWHEWPGGWGDRADLALLDAIYSTRQKYKTTVLPRLLIWKERYPSSEYCDLEYLSKLGESEIREVFGANVLPGVIIPGVRTGRRKSEGVKEVARRLCSPEFGLKSAKQIKDAVHREDFCSVSQLLQMTKGVGPATASYFLMLLGVDGVKVDTLLRSWVCTQLGNPMLSDEEITELVSRVAIEKFDRKATELDYAIWRHESAKRLRRKRKS